VSGPGPGPAPAGVRPVSPLSAPERGAGGAGGAVWIERPHGRAVRSAPSERLRWVAPGRFTLALGDRVVVVEHDREWLGEVVVPPERLVEWPELTDLPVVARRATDAEWPDVPVTDGRRLLDSLGLPPKLSARRGA
jgi:hypothetical protein